MYASQWETLAIQKQLRGQVAEELYSPALLRRLLRRWGNLPEIQRHEQVVEVASAQRGCAVSAVF